MYSAFKIAVLLTIVKHFSALLYACLFSYSCLLSAPTHESGERRETAEGSMILTSCNMHNKSTR